jgi:mRNA interferase RelE/StbE
MLQNNQFKITLVGNACKNLQRLPKKIQDKVLAQLKLLASNQKSLDIKKLQDLPFLYRIKVDSYRIIYKKDSKQKTYSVALICHRQKVYKLIKNLVGLL